MGVTALSVRSAQPSLSGGKGRKPLQIGVWSAMIGGARPEKEWCA